jgi:hypothetical protein
VAGFQVSTEVLTAQAYAGDLDTPSKEKRAQVVAALVGGSSIRAEIVALLDQEPD